MKRYMVVISILILFFARDSFAKPTPKKEVQQHGFLSASLGYSRYFVDPDVDLNLSGLTMEMKWVRLRKATYPIWGFESSEKGFNILYSKVLSGKIENKAKLDIIRGKNEDDEDDIVGEGVIESLRKVDKEVKEIGEGNDCGIKFTGTIHLEDGDILEVYKEEEKRRTIS